MTKLGLINLAGEYVLEPRFDALFQADDGGPTCVRTDGGQRTVLLNGDIVGGTWSDVWHDGSPAFEGQFEDAAWFSDGLAPVKVSGRWGFIDWSGNFRIDARFSFADAFNGGCARIRDEERRFGFIDRQGDWICPPKLESAENFSCGRAAAADPNGLYGYLDVLGRWIIPPRYKRPRNFSDGLAFVSTKDFHGFIDVCGRAAIEVARPWGAHDFSEGLCPVISRLAEPSMGYLDLHGQLVIPASFEFAGAFNGGFAAFRIGDNWGLIDRTGHYTIAARYKDVSSFNGGLVAIREGDLCRYVDPHGVPAFEKAFTSAGPFRDGLARVGVASG